MELRKTCGVCEAEYTPLLCTDPNFETKYRRWKGGELIQDAFPDTKEFEREQLLSGICSDECWKTLFPPEEEEEEGSDET